MSTPKDLASEILSGLKGVTPGRWCQFTPQYWGIIYLTPRDIRGRYLLMERIRRTLTRR
jgi:hypothetical protein